MRIAREFARAGGGVVAVLHDLNLTAHFADQVCVMQAGRVVRQGQAAQVLRPAILSPVYDCPLRLVLVGAGASPVISPDLAGL
jgi:iron complex transport system ATP-binding protein